MMVLTIPARFAPLRRFAGCGGGPPRRLGVHCRRKRAAAPDLDLIKQVEQGATLRSARSAVSALDPDPRLFERRPKRGWPELVRLQGSEVRGAGRDYSGEGWRFWRSLSGSRCFGRFTRCADGPAGQPDARIAGARIASRGAAQPPVDSLQKQEMRPTAGSSGGRRATGSVRGAGRLPGDHLPLAGLEGPHVGEADAKAVGAALRHDADAA
jgi:hypothetical protein